MRITIEIGGESPEQFRIGAAPPSQALAAPAATYGLTPPPEVLAAAAAVGAMNAGPAPIGPTAPGAPLAPTPLGAPQPIVGEAGDATAGAAPGAPSDANYPGAGG
jgi:hypothetical protein